MTVQTTYSATPAVAFSGMLAEDFALRQVDSYLCEADIIAGYAVKAGTAAGQANNISAYDDTVIGISLASTHIENASGLITYDDESALPVISKGRVYVTAGETVAAGESVFAGIPVVQTSTLVFDGDLVTSNVTTVTLGGYGIGAFTFASDHATTMGLIATGLEEDSRVDSATVATRTITIVGNTVGEAFACTAVVTAGSGQAVGTHTVTVAATGQTGKFYNDINSNTRTPVKAKFKGAAADGEVVMIELWETN